MLQVNRSTNRATEAVGFVVAVDGLFAETKVGDVDVPVRIQENAKEATVEMRSNNCDIARHDVAKPHFSGLRSR